MSQDGFWVTPPPLHCLQMGPYRPIGTFLAFWVPIGSLFSVFWLHSRKECQFFWLPGVPIGSLFPKTKWVPFGSPSQSLGVPIKFRDCAFAGQGPHFHPKKLLAPVIKGKVHLGNVYIAELWSASTQLNSCGLLISSHFMYAFRLFAT